MKKKKSKWLVNVILTILSCIWLSPVVFVLLNTFKGKQEYNLGSLWKLPEGNEFLANLKYVWNSKIIFAGMANSFL